MSAVRLAAMICLTAWLTGGCAFYQFRVWPNESVLRSDPEHSLLPPEAAPATAYRRDWLDGARSLVQALEMARALDRQYQSYSRTHERTGPILLTILTPLAATIAGLAI